MKVFLLLAVSLSIVTSHKHCTHETRETRDNQTRQSMRCVGHSITHLDWSEWSADIIYSQITYVHIDNTGIEVLNKSDLAVFPNVKNLHITNNVKLKEIQPDLLSDKHQISELVITGNKKLRYLDAGVFNFTSIIRYLHLYSNGLESVPDLSYMTVNGISSHEIELEIDDNPLTIPSQLCDCHKNLIPHGTTCIFSRVSMNNTQMTHFPSLILDGTHKISKLYLGNNKKLESISEDAFTRMKESPKLLYLSDNPLLSNLPSEGLTTLRKLYFENCPNIRSIPYTGSYEGISMVRLTYPQHCCAFRRPDLQKEVDQKMMETFMRDKCPNSTVNDPTSGYLFHKTTTVPEPESGGVFIDQKHLGNLVSELDDNRSKSDFDDPAYDIFMTKFVKPINPNKSHYIEFNCTESQLIRQAIDCSPSETPITPCINVLEEQHELRVILCVVFLLSIIGNITVIIFTIASAKNTPFTVTKFLICNLAIADLIQGLYLASLWIIDRISYGQYFNYAMQWQSGGGCEVVGFFTIFASELSVYTLAIITVERWYAISHAIHLTKRLQMSHAVGIMAVGWSISFALALLPIVGFSSYEVTSICLPFKYDTYMDKGYVLAILAINSLVFILVLACYLSIFKQVRGSNASNASDSANMAGRMAILVFTDLICWGPVAVVAGISAHGVNGGENLFVGISSPLLIAKYILVICYPLNACANPFLYAIFTKQFKKDCYNTLRRCGLKRYPKPKRLIESRTQLQTRPSLTSNATQNTSLTSTLDARYGAKRGSLDTYVQQMLTGGLDSKTSQEGSFSKEMKLMNSKPNLKPKRSFRSSAGYAGNTSLASSNSTLESRRPSDCVKVPATLIETDGADPSYPDTELTRLFSQPDAEQRLSHGEIIDEEAPLSQSCDDVEWSRRDSWFNRSVYSEHRADSLDSGAEIHEYESDHDVYITRSSYSETESGYRGRQASQEDEENFWKLQRRDTNFNSTACNEKNSTRSNPDFTLTSELSHIKS